MAWETLAQQNPYLREVELIHVGQEQACQTGSLVKASTVLVNVASPQQTNLLIWEGLECHLGWDEMGNGHAGPNPHAG